MIMGIKDMINPKIITFNTKGYGGFIDFIKAFAIICVLFGHTFTPILDKVGYGLWAGMQVPLFILVQVFHCFKKDNVTFNFKKVMRRVMIPFLVMEIIALALVLQIYKNDVKFLIFNGLIGGGYGPGSYYPWIYIQVAVLLPFFSWIYKSLGKINALIFSLLLCEGLELFFSFVRFSDTIYRLLVIRYLFLFYLGWIWVKDGIKNNWITNTLSVISLLATVWFVYFYTNIEPWFYDTSWTTHRWPCFVFVAYGLTSFLYCIWRGCKDNERFVTCVKQLASCSYEIFLVQMILLFFIGVKKTFFDLIRNQLSYYLVYIIIVWAISIIGGIMLNKILTRLNKKNFSKINVACKEDTYK